MKKRSLNIMLAAVLLGTFSLTTISCEKKKNEEKPNTEEVTTETVTIENEVVKEGETYTIKATKKNVLVGSIVVKKGGKLVVEAGAKVNCVGGTTAFITVEKGGKIDVQGTKDKPVVFTNDEQKIQGWGGIVLVGDAPVNVGSGTIEVGGTVAYGGNNPADSSGSIRYCRIEYSGAKFSDTKEYNGLSLFGVGSGTILENIAIINGADDGIEFFGGTASVENLVLIGNEDDQFDWTEGWTGSATNVYAKRRANGTGNRGIEADSNKNNNAAEPVSNPTIKNVTLIGSKDGKESQAVKLRVGTKGKLENVVISNWKTGFDIESVQSATWFADGANISKVKFEEVETPVKVKEGDGSAFNMESDSSATGAGNGVELPDWAKGWAE